MHTHTHTHTHTCVHPHTHPHMCAPYTRAHTHAHICTHTSTHTHHQHDHQISQKTLWWRKCTDLLMKGLMGGWMHALVQWFHWQPDGLINRLFSFAKQLSLTADQLSEWLMLTLTLSWLPHQPCCRHWERQSRSQTSHSLLIWPEMSPLHTTASPNYEVFLYYLYIYTISYYNNNGICK